MPEWTHLELLFYEIRGLNFVYATFDAIVIWFVLSIYLGDGSAVLDPRCSL